MFIFDLLINYALLGLILEDMATNKYCNLIGSEGQYHIWNNRSKGCNHTKYHFSCTL